MVSVMGRTFRRDLMIAARNGRGMSQYQLANLLREHGGVACSLATVKRWEKGKTVPGIDEAEAIAKCLGVTINHLTGWGGRKVDA